MTVNSLHGLRSLQSFHFRPTIQVRFGAHSLNELGDVGKELGATQVLLVTDQGLMDAGHAERAADILKKAGFNVHIFKDVQENPTTDVVEQCKAFAEAAGSIDLIVGLGGGSAMDCAKGVNFLLSNGGKMEDYWGKGLAKKPMLPSIGIPTTAGTGSEAQCFALISQKKSHRKMACGDIKARFNTVILDPELLTSVPRNVTATTGMDAITHALESFVTQNRNPISQCFAKEAWHLLDANFERVLRDRNDLEAWGSMLIGAHLAGCAIENSMLGAAHACANPLTAQFDVVHGTAVALMLPHVIRFNASDVAPLYKELAGAVNLPVNGHQTTAIDAAMALAERVEMLVEIAGLPAHLGHFGITGEAVAALAKDAKTQWTGTFNPKPVSQEQYETLYTAALT